MAFQWIGKSKDGTTVTLHKLDLSHFKFPDYYSDSWVEQNRDLIRIGLALDVETTGLQYQSDQIIEIGARQFEFNRETGEILSLKKSYTSFHDPGFSISPEITEITGITDEMVKGHLIDWIQLDTILNEAHVIVAHNASFDRPFVDRCSSVSRTKVWGCSLKQIPWRSFGFPSSKLEVLGVYHGFFNDSHRAMNDVDSLIHLLGFPNPMNQKPYFMDLMKEARKSSVQVIASQSPFESKDLLKNRSYRWDAQQRYWAKTISKDDLDSELEWLESEVYHGAFRGRIHEIQPSDQFKAPV